MLLRVDPDEVIHAGRRLADVGPRLRAVAALVRGCAATAEAAGTPALACALWALGERGQAAVEVLAEGTETLAAGLGQAGRRYAEVEDRLAVLGRRIPG